MDNWRLVWLSWQPIHARFPSISIAFGRNVPQPEEEGEEEEEEGGIRRPRGHLRLRSITWS